METNLQEARHCKTKQGGGGYDTERRKITEADSNTKTSQGKPSERADPEPSHFCAATWSPGMAGQIVAKKKQNARGMSKDVPCCSLVTDLEVPTLDEKDCLDDGEDVRVATDSLSTVQSEVDCDIIPDGQTALDRATSHKIKDWDGVVDAAEEITIKTLSAQTALVINNSRVSV